VRKLIESLVEFREKRLPQYQERFAALATGQSPEVLLITCSDSRVVPELIAATDPGELFVMRNVGNMVPPATVDGASTGDVSEASAIEYATLALGVKHVVVCGHSECGAMKAALAREPMDETPNLERWLHHAAAARFRLEQEGPLDPALSGHDQLSQLNVLVQLEHLATYPAVGERLAKGTLHLSGFWFDIGRGEMHAYQRARRRFAPLDREAGERLLEGWGTSG
jgi:carbonic anhydrase